ncbi:MAG: hypothetical protein K2W97_04825 [Chthoniobacterales bacterium]|nr:hypothetical protein [Chthoniobacterales bacterium]
MKAKTPLFLSQAARLLLITCATLASCLFSLESTKAQENTLPLIYQISTDTSIHIPQDTKVISSSLTLNTLNLDANSTLIIDGTLRFKSLNVGGSNVTIILTPGSTLDLGCSSIVLSSLTLADGKQLTNGELSLPLQLSNGATVISTISLGANGGSLFFVHDAFAYDYPNGVHLIESNEHSSVPTSGTITLRNQN